MNIFKISLILLLLLPTYITLAQPLGYYNGTENLNGNELKSALHNIIKGHVDFSYSRAKDIINYSDADTANPENVILFYLQESRDASLYGTGGDYINREHVWAKSHGGFTEVRPMYSDVHNLRPADASVNEDRGAKDFDNVQPNGTQDSEAVNCWYNDSAWEPGPKTKGQVARILFYMATRYEGDNDEIDLELVDNLNNYPFPKFGKLSTLLEWNNEYPPSDFERRRNKRIYEIQQNRNPFIDNPDFANLIWNGESPKDIQFSELGMTPGTPVAGENATISVKIDSETEPDSIMLFWGDTYDSQQNKELLTKDSDKYSAQVTFSNTEAGEIIYFLIRAFAGNDTSTVRGTYNFPEDIRKDDLTSISDIQGTSSQSPLLNQQVTVTGRVTANFDNTIYIQDKTLPFRGGICIYNSLQTGNIGDSIIVRGKVSEYATLTELSDINYIYNFKNTDKLEPTIINTSEISEDYEGMLVTIKNAIFDEGGKSIPSENTSFTFSDSYGQGVLYSAWNSRLVRHAIPNDRVDITGIVSEYNGTYQILARDFNDLAIVTSSTIHPDFRDDVVIYPNPARSRLYLSTTKEIGSVAIYSVNGELKQKIKNPGTDIDISGFSQGVYFLTISIGKERVIHKKFIISK